MLKIDRIQYMYSGYEILYPDPHTAMATAIYVFTTFMYFQISLIWWIKISGRPALVFYCTCRRQAILLQIDYFSRSNNATRRITRSKERSGANHHPASRRLNWRTCGIASTWRRSERTPMQLAQAPRKWWGPYDDCTEPNDALQNLWYTSEFESIWMWKVVTFEDYFVQGHASSTRRSIFQPLSSKTRLQHKKFDGKFKGLELS